MAKKKSQDGDYTKFSLPQPHHPSTQPKANDDMEVSEMVTPQEAQSQQAAPEQAPSQEAQSQQASPQQAQIQESQLPELDP